MVAALDDMSERGLISRNNESWQLGLAPKRSDLEVPKSLQQMIEVQIERLSAEEQRVLEVASLECPGSSRFAVVLQSCVNQIWSRKRLKKCVKDFRGGITLCGWQPLRSSPTGALPRATNLCMPSTARCAIGELLRDAERRCTGD